MTTKNVFRATAEEMTSPKGARFVVPKPTQTRLANVSHHDPISERLANAELIGSPDIDNSGRAALRVRNHAFEINDIYIDKTEAELEERDRNGGMTDEELSRFTYSLYHSDEFLHSGSASAETFTKGSVCFRVVRDQNGNISYLDNHLSCVMPSAVLGDTSGVRSIANYVDKGPAMNDDLIDAGQQLSITYKLDSNGQLAPRPAAEVGFMTAMARIDNQYTKLPLELDAIDRITAGAIAQPKTAPSFTTAADTPIKADVAPTPTFSEAVRQAREDADFQKIMLKLVPHQKAPAQLSLSEPSLELTN